MLITFVCTGNVCRSPMAEGIARKIIEEKNIQGITVSSAGTDACEGNAASENSIIACEEIGIDISSHRSRILTHELVDNTDLFVCMTASHANIMKYCGVSRDKVMLLGNGIPDPYGCSINVYRECRDAMLPYIESIISDCAKKESNTDE